MSDNLKSREITLAIFPFENLTALRELEFLSRFFHIELITALSKFRQFKVTAYDSFISLHDTNLDYTIRGSINAILETVRINVQLIDHHDNRVAWAHRYEFRSDASISVQENTLREFVSSLQQQLNHDLLLHVRKKTQVQLTAYEHWLCGMEELKKGSLASDEKAREYFRQAIDIDLNFSLAYSGMSLTYFNEWSCQLWERWEVSQKGAYEWALQAIELDDQNYVASFILGRIYLYEASYDKAEIFLRRALTLNPHDVEVLILVSVSFVFLGLVEEADTLYQKATQLLPLNAAKYNHVGAFIALEKGEFEKCISLATTTHSPWVDFRAMIAAAYYLTDDLQNMERHWKLFVKEFQEKIVKSERPVTSEEALQWIINVNPYKKASTMMPFWEFMSGKKLILTNRAFDKVSAVEQGNYFLKEDEFWCICFEGKCIRIAEVKGLYDIVKLIAHPDKPFHCTALMGDVVVSRPELVFDEKAKRSYQKRIAELKEELEVCEHNSDYQRSDVLHQEYEQLINHLSSSLGLRGRTRKTNDAVDKTRSAVTWRIRHAIQRIEKLHPALGKHLAVSIQTGTFCKYTPEKSIDWLIQITK